MVVTAQLRDRTGERDNRPRATVASPTSGRQNATTTGRTNELSNGTNCTAAALGSWSVMTARSCAHVPLTPSISRFASPGRGCRSRFAANSRPPAAAALSAAHTTDAPSPLYCLAPIARKALMTIWIGCRTPSVGVDAGGRSWRYTAGPSLLTVRSPFLRSRPPRVAVSGIRIRPDGQVSLKPSTEARDERGRLSQRNFATEPVSVTIAREQPSRRRQAGGRTQQPQDGQMSCPTGRTARRPPWGRGR